MYNILKYSFITLLVGLFLSACTGSKKYFKAAEKLEKQGLVNEAAEYYMESLNRNHNNIDARIKLKEVGQKYVDFLSSQFFREYNTNQFEKSIKTFEHLKDFYDKASALQVQLDFPSAYTDDYQQAVQNYMEDNYIKGEKLFKQKKYTDAIVYFEKVKKYSSDYKKVQSLFVTAKCEPAYQDINLDIENKNYEHALKSISDIYKITDNYKDVKDLEVICNGALNKNILIFKPQNNYDKELSDLYINNLFTLTTKTNTHIKLIDNPVFSNIFFEQIQNDQELLKAIAKSTNTDYFYYYKLINKKVYSPSPQKKEAAAFLRYFAKQGEVVVPQVTTVPYYSVKAQKSFSFDYNYKLIQTKTTQTIASQNIPIQVFDNKEYNEFVSKPLADINDYFPYNPITTPIFNQYNTKEWRQLFFVNKQMKTDDELKTDALNKAVQQYQQMLSSFVK